MKVLVLGSEDYAVPFSHEDVTISSSFAVTPDQLDKYDYVVFTGGSDISPYYYKETKHSNTDCCDIHRDAAEIRLMSLCILKHIPTVGICRGMQLQTIINGGKLVQDISHHSSYHSIQTYENKTIQVNSLHHQLCVPVGNVKVLAWHEPVEEHNYRGVPVEWRRLLSNQLQPCKDPEALWFPDTNCVGVQYHPEQMLEDTEGYKFFQHILNNFIYEIN